MATSTVTFQKWKLDHATRLSKSLSCLPWSTGAIGGCQGFAKLLQSYKNHCVKVHSSGKKVRHLTAFPTADCMMRLCDLVTLIFPALCPAVLPPTSTPTCGIGPEARKLPLLENLPMSTDWASFSRQLSNTPWKFLLLNELTGAVTCPRTNLILTWVHLTPGHALCPQPSCLSSCNF